MFHRVTDASKVALVRWWNICGRGSYPAGYAVDTATGAVWDVPDPEGDLLAIATIGREARPQVLRKFRVTSRGDLSSRKRGRPDAASRRLWSIPKNEPVPRSALEQVERRISRG